MDLSKPLPPPPITKRPKGWGKRHSLAILGFWACGISYAMRFNLSIAIVVMAKSSKVTNNDQNYNLSSNLENTPVSCPHLMTPTLVSKNLESEEFNDELQNANSEDEFEWTESEVGVILGSFFWGYLITQLPGGILATKFGGKWPLGIGLLVTAIFTVITPQAARINKYCLMVVRVIQGLGEGIQYPAFHSIFSNWSPPEERSQLTSIAYAGAQFGTAVTMVISGYIIHYLGWPSVFYFTGGFSFIWFICWALFMSNTPAEHPNISQEEKDYIEQSLKSQTCEIKMPTPWKKILSSLPFWAILIANTGHAYGLYTLLHGIPQYLKTVLHFDIKQNSWISAFPHLLMWIMSILLTLLADTLIMRGFWKIGTSRKVCQAIAHIGSALALVIVSFTGCHRLFSVILITIAVAINGAIYGGYPVNIMDIGKNHAGVILGITNSIGNICGFLAPAVLGFIIDKNPTLERWKYVFFISAAIYAVEVLFFVIFASGKEQSWNKPAKIPSGDVERKNSRNRGQEETLF